MKILLIVTGFVAVSATAVAPSSRRAVAEKTTWDSVYTANQAARGETLYKSTCLKCHGAMLTGGDDGSPLTGTTFLGNWNGLAMDQLFDKTYTTMPSDKPKSLPRKDYADILAYILSQNQFPSGSMVLTDSMELLREIKIVASR